MRLCRLSVEVGTDCQSDHRGRTAFLTPRCGMKSVPHSLIGLKIDGAGRVIGRASRHLTHPVCWAVAIESYRSALSVKLKILPAGSDVINRKFAALFFWRISRRISRRIYLRISWRISRRISRPGEFPGEFIRDLYEGARERGLVSASHTRHVGALVLRLEGPFGLRCRDPASSGPSR